MRHSKHRHTLGVKKEHRKALITNLAAALLTHGRIETTLAKAKALRPFVERVITFAKKASAAQDPIRKLHYRRLAYARMRNKKAAVDLLFEERVSEFLERPGGYARIYKLMPRVGDAANMAIIELIDGSDEGYKKRKNTKSRKKAKATTAEKADEVKASEETAEAPEAPEVKAEEKTEATSEEKQDS